MQAVTTIGLDIAKSVFQVHGIDAEGKVRLAPGEPFRVAARFSCLRARRGRSYLNREKCRLRELIASAGNAVRDTT
jgi:hypothetical protein